MTKYFQIFHCPAPCKIPDGDRIRFENIFIPGLVGVMLLVVVVIYQDKRLQLSTVTADKIGGNVGHLVVSICLGGTRGTRQPSQFTQT